jgi:pilus assembly protein CpaE
MGAKGGCGASLVATNLAVALTRHGSVLLVDLHEGDGNDDLLLDLRGERSWADLLPVASELNRRHLELAARTHATGLKFLASANAPMENDSRPVNLLAGLSPWFDAVVVDLPGRRVKEIAGLADLTGIVLTADPPSLRGAQRLLTDLPSTARTRARLILNQHGRAHPSTPAAIASSLECPLLGVIPPDARAVGFQVNFGQPCVMDPRSSFGRAAGTIARSVARPSTRKSAA